MLNLTKQCLWLLFLPLLAAAAVGQDLPGPASASPESGSWAASYPAVLPSDPDRCSVRSPVVLPSSPDYRTGRSPAAQLSNQNALAPPLQRSGLPAASSFWPPDQGDPGLFPPGLPGSLTPASAWPQRSPAAVMPLQATGRAPHLEWRRTLSSPMQPNYERAAALAVDRAGALYTVAAVLDPSGGLDILTCKYSSEGTLVWSVLYDDQWSGDDLPVECAIDHEGNLLVSGFSARLPNLWDILVIKYNSSGEQQWLLRHSLAADLTNEVRDMAVDASGHTYLAGYSSSRVGGAGGSGFLCKVDPGGRVLWTLERSGFQFVRLVLGTEESLYVAAESNGKLVLLRFSAAGEEIWQYEDTTLEHWYQTHTLRCDSAGNVLLTGRGVLSDESSSRAAPIFKIDPRGELVWRVFCLDSLQREEYSYPELVVDDRMNCYAVFARDGYYNNPGYILVKLNAAGSEAWRTIEEDNFYSAMTVDAAGRLVIGESGEQWGIQIYSPAGKKEASLLHSGAETGFREIAALAIDADGNYCFAGTLRRVNGAEIAVGRIGAGGGTFWEKVRERAAETTSYAHSTAQMLLTPQDDLYLGLRVLNKYDRRGRFLWSIPLQASRIQLDKNGNLYFAGTHRPDYNSLDLVCGKVSASGGLLWSSYYDGTSDPDDPADDIPEQLALDAEGNLLVQIRRGFSRDVWRQDYVVLKYSSSGVRLWERAITSRQSDKYLDCRAMAVDEQGDVYVTGFGWQDELQESQNFLAKYSPAGELLWKRYPTRGMDDAGTVYDMALAGDYGLFLACEHIMRTEYLWNDNEIVLINCDREGKRRQVGRYGIPDGWIGYDKRMHVTQQGGVNLLGSIYDRLTGSWYGFLTTFTAYCAPVWSEKLLFTDLNDWDFDPLDNILVTGEEWISQQMFTAKYSSSGELLWSMLLPKERPTEDHGDQIAVGRTGGIFIAGSRSGYAWGESFLLKYSEGDSALTQQLTLRQNYPNPCRKQTRIRFNLVKSAAVELRLYNIAGQKVLHHQLGVRQAGENEYQLTLPAAVATGIYFYEVESGGRRCSRKMVVLP